MSMNHRTFGFLRCSVALASFAASGLVAHAQQSTVTAVPPALNLAAPTEAIYSSSLDGKTDSAVAAAPLDLNDPLGVRAAAQPPGRRNGHPRYRGGNTNPDGSSKYAFLVGGGLSAPVGDAHTYLTPSYGFQVGGGRNFDKTFGVLLQFDYDHFGFQGSTLANQLALYNKIIDYYNNQIPPPSSPISHLSSLDGSSHVWSISIDPTINLNAGSDTGIYVVGGVGFYHKTANFTVPSTATYCDPYYGCYQYAANQTIDKYTSNAAGLNGGVGITHKLSRFSNERFYVEARYVYVFNQPRPGVTLATVTAANAGAFNDYPANANRTSYFPVKVGIRF